MLITRVTDGTTLDIITTWWYQEWRTTYLAAGLDTLQKAQVDARVRVNNETMMVLVAREGSLPICACALVEYTDPANPTARNWLANVYTLEDYRQEGFGSHIVREAIRYASGVLGWDVLWITCPVTLEDWYGALGFVKVRCVNTTVYMRQDIGPMSPMLSPTVFSVCPPSSDE